MYNVCRNITKIYIKSHKTFKFIIHSEYCIVIVKLYQSNRGIKTQRTNETKLPLQYCMNDITIMIGK